MPSAESSGSTTHEVPAPAGAVSLDEFLPGAGSSTLKEDRQRAVSGHGGRDVEYEDASGHDVSIALAMDAPQREQKSRGTHAPVSTASWSMLKTPWKRKEARNEVSWRMVANICAWAPGGFCVAPQMARRWYRTVFSQLGPRPVLSYRCARASKETPDRLETTLAAPKKTKHHFLPCLKRHESRCMRRIASHICCCCA